MERVWIELVGGKLDRVASLAASSRDGNRRKTYGRKDMSNNGGNGWIIVLEHCFESIIFRKTLKDLISTMIIDKELT